MTKGHYCAYCNKKMPSDTGYCSDSCADLDRGFLGGVGGANHPNEIERIRDALAKWDATPHIGQHPAMVARTRPQDDLGRCVRICAGISSGNTWGMK